MVYISQIINDKNGMSYIGQEETIGGCLEEQLHSDSPLGKAIKADGIENFTIHVLKEVEESEAFLWEDYYVMQYNSMYPNGYNMRWNCSEDLREILCNQLALDENNKQSIIQSHSIELPQEKHLHEQALRIEQELMKEQEPSEFIPPLTVKHWDVYYCLLEKSSYDSDYKSTIDKEDVNMSQIANELSMALSTVYVGIDRLKKNGYIKEDSNKYIIFLTDTKNLRYKEFRDKVSFHITSELDWLNYHLNFDNPEKSELLREKIQRAQEICYGLLNMNTKLGKELIDYGRDLLECTDQEFEFEKLL